MRRQSVWPSILPMMLVNTGDQDMLVGVQMRLSVFSVLPTPSMKNGRVVVRRATTGIKREQSHNDKGAELVPTCGHWEIKPPALTFTGHVSHRTCSAGRPCTLQKAEYS